MLLRNIPGILWRAAVQFVSGGSTPFDLIESFDPEAESLSEQEALRRMTFSPINPKTLVRGDGQQVRLFTRPKWVRPDGRTWTPIEQLVDVRYDPLTQGFRVTHNGEWTVVHGVTAGTHKRVYLLTTILSNSKALQGGISLRT